MEITDVLGLLGFFLAVLLALLEARRYNRPLVIRLTELEHEGDGKTWSMFTARISFVNPASLGKTIFEIGFDQPACHSQHYTVTQAIGTRELSKSLVVFEPPDESSSFDLAAFPENDALFLPLDVLPHQSVSRWIAFGVSPIPPYNKGSDTIQFQLCAYDVRGKRMAKTTVILKEPETVVKRKM